METAKTSAPCRAGGESVFPSHFYQAKMDEKERIIRNIAANIARLRAQNGMTQSELAEKLRYSDKAVSKWERAESLPDVTVLKAVADLFGVTVDALMTEDAPVPAESAGAEEAEPEGFRLGHVRFPMSGRHLAVTALSLLLVWFVAVVAFVLLRWFVPQVPAWLAFVAAVPVSCIVLLVFNSLWGRKSWNQAIISVLMWSVLTLLFLSSVGVRPWMFFLFGIPAQAALVVWYFLAKNKKTPPCLPPQ